ncbi:MAG: pyridoxamine 5'-phosphate oxidase family protein [Candidatus Thorarchaeota archaeon]|nr:pyridoxamine 5'-phosphate oxidase family protein [Candidatus Thorarchaeota archaeon]
MREIRRKEKAIKTHAEMALILKRAAHVTLAMVDGNQPYLVTLSHGYDEPNNCVYFHCAREGRKIDVLKQNPSVWGQALLDFGYVQGECTHRYATTQFQGTVSFVEDLKEKRHALEVMVHALDSDPEEVLAKQVDEGSLQRVMIGRVDISFMSGKKSNDVVLE